MTKYIYRVFAFLAIVLIILCSLETVDGFLKLPKIKLKPVVNTATDVVGDLADFTLNEVLNFGNFKSLFKKVYATVDLENIALLNFLTNQRAIRKHNKKYKKGLVPYSRGLTEYSDMTADDMNRIINRFVVMKKEEEDDEEAEESKDEPEVVEEDEPEDEPEEDEITEEPKEETTEEPEEQFEELEEETTEEPIEEEEPEDYIETTVKAKKKTTKKVRLQNAHSEDSDSLDYTALGYINPVQNQGLCGSCWSFSSTAAIEAQYFKKTGKLIKLSEQQLIDCNRHDVDGNFGCGGGNMAVAFEFIEKNLGGVALSDSYPYLGNDTFTCKSAESAVTVISHKLIEAGDEVGLKEALIKHGPISIAVDASLATFQSYKSGVFYDPECSKNVNHAVLLVGFGTDETTNQDYWLIKNTYGTTWGMKGFMMLARNKDNHCGVCEYAAYPYIDN